jgi:hypothetical protein
LMPIYKNLTKFKFKCTNGRGLKNVFFTRLLGIHSSFLHIFSRLF